MRIIHTIHAVSPFFLFQKFGKRHYRLPARLLHPCCATAAECSLSGFFPYRFWLQFSSQYLRGVAEKVAGYVGFSACKNKKYAKNFRLKFNFLQFPAQCSQFLPAQGDALLHLPPVLSRPPLPKVVLRLFVAVLDDIQLHGQLSRVADGGKMLLNFVGKGHVRSSLVV